MNKLTSTISIKLMHGKLTAAQFSKLLRRIAKAAQGRSQRSVGVFCGSESTWLWGKEKSDHITQTKKRGKTLVEIFAK